MLQRAGLCQPLPLSPVREILNRKLSPSHLAYYGKLQLKDSLALQEVRLDFRSKRVKQFDNCTLHSIQERTNKKDKDPGGWGRRRHHRWRCHRLAQLVIFPQARHSAGSHRFYLSDSARIAQPAPAVSPYTTVRSNTSANLAVTAVAV